MFKKMLLAAMAACLISACGNKNDSKDNDEIPIPSSLDFSVPEKTDISAVIEEEMKYWDKRAEFLSAEEYSVYDQYQSQKQREEKQKRFNSKGPEVKAFVEQLKKNCEIQQPYKITEGKVTDQVGSKESEIKKYKINGTKCPLESNASEYSQSVLTNINKAALTAKGNIKYSLAKFVEFKSQGHIQNTQVKSLNSAMDLSGTVHVQAYSNGSTAKNIYARGPVTYVIKTAEHGDISLSGRVEMLATEGREDFVVRGTIKYPSGTVGVLMFQQGELRKLYINGQDYTSKLDIGLGNVAGGVKAKAAQ